MDVRRFGFQSWDDGTRLYRASRGPAILPHPLLRLEPCRCWCKPTQPNPTQRTLSPSAAPPRLNQPPSPPLLLLLLLLLSLLFLLLILSFTTLGLPPTATYRRTLPPTPSPPPPHPPTTASRPPPASVLRLSNQPRYNLLNQCRHTYTHSELSSSVLVSSPAITTLRTLSDTRVHFARSIPQPGRKNLNVSRSARSSNGSSKQPRAVFQGISRPRRDPLSSNLRGWNWVSSN